jgi:hypothetical protein
MAKERVDRARKMVSSPSLPHPTPPMRLRYISEIFLFSGGGDTRTVEIISPYTLCTENRSFSSTLMDHTFPLCAFSTNASSYDI